MTEREALLTKLLNDMHRVVVEMFLVSKAPHSKAFLTLDRRMRAAGVFEKKT